MRGAQVGDVIVATPRKDLMIETSRKFFIVGAFLMPMLTFRIAGTNTATTTTGLTLSDLFFFFSAIALAMTIRRSKLRSTPTWFLGSFLVVVGGITASFFAVTKIGSILVVFRMIYVLVVWQWTIRNLLGDQSWLRRAMTAYVVGCSVDGIVTILQLKLHVLISLGSLYNGRAAGLAHHPDDTGSFLALGLVFALGLALNRDKGRRWFRLICIALISIGLIITGSVSGMICGILGCFVLLIRRGLSIKRLVTIAFVVVGVYIAGTALQGHGGKSLNPLARFFAATGSASTNNSTHAREGTWSGAWHGIVNSPIFGHGLDIFSSLVYLDPHIGVEYPTHNFILMSWYQGGILFLIGVTLCIVSAFRRLLRGERDLFKDTVLGGAVAVLAFSMQAPVMFDRYFWFPFILAMTFPQVTAKMRHVYGVELKTREVAPAIGRDP